jgi:hypothetical protein
LSWRAEDWWYWDTEDGGYFRVRRAAIKRSAVGGRVENIVTRSGAEYGAATWLDAASLTVLRALSFRRVEYSIEDTFGVVVGNGKAGTLGDTIGAAMRVAIGGRTRDASCGGVKDTMGAKIREA